MVQKLVISAPASIRISFLITAPIRVVVVVVRVRDAKSTGVRDWYRKKVASERKTSSTRSLKQFNFQLSVKSSNDTCSTIATPFRYVISYSNHFSTFTRRVESFYHHFSIIEIYKKRVDGLSERKQPFFFFLFFLENEESRAHDVQVLAKQGRRVAIDGNIVFLRKLP